MGLEISWCKSCYGVCKFRHIPEEGIINIYEELCEGCKKKKKKDEEIEEKKT